MTKQELQQLIISYIYENNSEDISGSILQNILIQISDKLSDGLYFGGVVNDESVLTPDINSFYLCLNSGTYQSFDDVVVENSDKIQYLFHDGTFWNVGELPIPTFDFINIAKSSLYGGVITPNEEPTYGDDHRYFYLAFQEGRYTHFNNNYVDSQVCLFYWSETLSNWLMLSLWESSESLSALLSGKADRVNSPINGHLVGLDAEGSLTDSGIAASDVVTTVDNSLSSTSENPVQNKVIKNIIDALNAAKQDLLPEGSVFGGFVNPSSIPDTKYYYLTNIGGIYTYFDNTSVNDDGLTLFYHKNNSWQNSIIAPSYQLASKALLSEDLYVALGFPLFDSSLNYAQGDVVVYEGYLYVFTTDHHGQWDESDVEYNNINKELKDLYVDLAEQIDGKQDILTIDPTPTDDSTNPVQSGGVYEALDTKADKVQLATNNDIATLGANGNLKDSGVSIGSVAMDADVVHKNGNETISGEKTFADKTIFGNEVKLIDSNEIGATFLSSEEGKIEFYGSPSEGTVQLKNITSPSASSDAATKGYVDNEVAGKQDTISDLATIRSGAAAGATALQPSDITPIENAISIIESVIPAQASAQNQLADKNFVNSQVTTASANFVGTFETLAELQAVQNPTKNDYGFVIETDALGNQYYDRYKYNGTTWLFEYKVESTSFTSEQWAAIQSGITSALVQKINDVIPSNASSSNKLATTSDVNEKLNAPATAGTSGQVLTSDGQGGQSWQTPTSGVSSYNELNDQPSINDVTLSGNRTLSQLGIQSELTFDNMPTENSNNPVKSGGVKTALDSKQDTLVSGTSIKTVNDTSLLGSGNIQINDGVGFQTITTQQDGTMVITLTNGDTITIDLNHAHPNYYKKTAETSQPSGGMLPDVTYKLGTLTGATTFLFAAAVSGNVNHYYFTFISGSTAVVPTWPASITSWDGNCVNTNTGLPVIATNKTYEVSVLDGNAIIKEW